MILKYMILPIIWILSKEKVCEMLYLFYQHKPWCVCLWEITYPFTFKEKPNGIHYKKGAVQKLGFRKTENKFQQKTGNNPNFLLSFLFSKIVKFRAWDFLYNPYQIAKAWNDLG